MYSVCVCVVCALWCVCVCVCICVCVCVCVCVCFFSYLIYVLVFVSVLLGDVPFARLPVLSSLLSTSRIGGDSAHFPSHFLSPPGSSVVVLSLPEATLESSGSCVLDRPVKRGTLCDTLPWQLCLNRLSLFTLFVEDDRSRVEYVLAPTGMSVSVVAMGTAKQGLMFHSDLHPVSLYISRKQVQYMYSTL